MTPEYELEDREVKRLEPFLVARFEIDEAKVDEIVARHVRTNIPIGERDDIVEINVSAMIRYREFDGYTIEIVKKGSSNG